MIVIMIDGGVDGGDNDDNDDNDDVYGDDNGDSDAWFLC